jgi:serine/threonine protein kinase
LTNWVGKTLANRYVVERKIGEGGMGMVFEARQISLSKPVAIKVLTRDVTQHPEVFARFRTEAEVTTSIRHPNIVDILDFGELEDGSPFFVMELLDGEPLVDVLRREGRLSQTRSIRIAVQIARALAAAHERGVIHRDLKPDNVHVLAHDGGEEFVKVLDFGLAKVTNASGVTREGQVFGTPRYMSPEQASGIVVDERSDIYSLGVMLYELVAGRCPFEADTMLAILGMHRFDPPPPLRSLHPPAEVSASLEAIVMRCLAKDPAARYPSMAALRDELSGLMTSPTLLAAGTPPSAASLAGGTSPVPPTQVFIEGSSSRRPAAPAKPDKPVSAPPAASRNRRLFVGAALAIVTIVVALTFARRSSEIDDFDTEEAELTQHTVVLASDPEGAEVFHGAELVGNTPLPVPRPHPGHRLELELRARGYKPTRVTLSNASERTVRVDLDNE